jgi:hypothetical protein
MPVRRRSPAPLALAIAVCGGLAGCGGSEGGYACSGDSVCTVTGEGPIEVQLDQLGTEVALTDLTADAVRVRINAEQRTVRRGQTVRLRGFLVTATTTGTDRAEVRLER